MRSQSKLLTKLRKERLLERLEIADYLKTEALLDLDGYKYLDQIKSECELLLNRLSQNAELGDLEKLKEILNTELSKKKQDAKFAEILPDKEMSVDIKVKFGITFQNVAINQAIELIDDECSDIYLSPDAIESIKNIIRKGSIGVVVEKSIQHLDNIAKRSNKDNPEPLDHGRVASIIYLEMTKVVVAEEAIRDLFKIEKLNRLIQGLPDALEKRRQSETASRHSSPDNDRKSSLLPSSPLDPSKPKQNHLTNPTPKRSSVIPEGDDNHTIDQVPGAIKATTQAQSGAKSHLSTKVSTTSKTSPRNFIQENISMFQGRSNTSKSTPKATPKELHTSKSTPKSTTKPTATRTSSLKTTQKPQTLHQILSSKDLSLDEMIEAVKSNSKKINKLENGKTPLRLVLENVDIGYDDKTNLVKECIKAGANINLFGGKVLLVKLASDLDKKEASNEVKAEKTLAEILSGNTKIQPKPSNVSKASAGNVDRPKSGVATNPTKRASAIAAQKRSGRGDFG